MPDQLNAIILCAVSTPEQAADDKQSLNTQERELRSIAEARNWNVIKVLHIPGFSRDYISWEECAAEMLKARPPITAMADLKSLCTPTSGRPQFDVLMVRDADRFGRTQSLIMQVAETICVRLGLKIYSQMDNQLVEGLQSRFWAAMTGLRAANDQDKRKKYFHDGMKRRLENGLPTVFMKTMTHLPVRDSRGDVVSYAVRKDMIAFWDAFADIICRTGPKGAPDAYVPWSKIPTTLANEYGFTRPDGRLHFVGTLLRAVLSPIAWGNMGRFYRNQWGLWAFDESEPLPPGVEIRRNTHEPLWTGALADKIMDRLRRRSNIGRGKSFLAYTSAFSGLLICAGCNRKMMSQYREATQIRVYHCASGVKTTIKQTGVVCKSKPKRISYERLQDWFNGKLEQVLAARSISPLIDTVNPASFEMDIERVAQELAQVQETLAGLYVQKASAKSGTVLQRVIDDYEAKDERLSHDINHLRQRMASAQTADRAAGRVIAEIEGIGLKDFWAMPHPRINALLFELLSGNYIHIMDGKVSHVGPYRQRRRYSKLSSQPQL